MIPTTMLHQISNAEQSVLSGSQERDYDHCRRIVQLYVICRMRRGVIME